MHDGGGGAARQGCMRGEGHAWQWGTCVSGGGGHACVAGEMATAADGTHHTGMLSCLVQALGHNEQIVFFSIGKE